LKFQDLITIQHVDGAKEWKGLLSKRLLIFMPDFSFGLDRRSERVKRKIKYCADMVFRIVYNDGEDVGSANAFVMRV